MLENYNKFLRQPFVDVYDTHWAPAVVDVFTRQMASTVRRGDRVVDLGCGSGLVTGYTRRAAGKPEFVVGCDPDLEYLGIANSRENAVNLIAGTGEQLPFESDSFDTALCLQGLQFVAERQAVLGEVKRVLSSRGVFRAMIWSGAKEQKAFGFLDRAVTEILGVHYDHVFSWNYGGCEELTELMHNSGLTVKEVCVQENCTRFHTIQYFIDTILACVFLIGLEAYPDSIDPTSEDWPIKIEAFSVFQRHIKAYGTNSWSTCGSLRMADRKSVV